MKKFTLAPLTFAPLALALLAISSAGHAAPFSGNQSDNTNIEVGESVINGGPHVSGRAGIGVNTSGMDTDDKIDFQGIMIYSPAVDGVHTLSTAPASHGGMGVFSFAQAGTADVWFGEWSQDGTSGFTDRAVYYVGDKSGTTMPISGIATYSVQGVSKFDPGTGNDLNGDFTVNFGAATVEGEIENGSLGIYVDATISGSTFSGDAEAYDSSNGANLAYGDSEGEFYGVSAAVLAGMATFSGSDAQYNTAFGGSKD